MHTLALLRTWTCTLSYGVHSYAQHTHHVQYTCHTSYVWKTINCDVGTNTHTHKHSHIQMHSIQFKCTCACLCRPLILFQFMYQAFCTLFFLGIVAWIHFFDNYPEHVCMLSSLFVHYIKPSLEILYIHVGVCSLHALSHRIGPLYMCTSCPIGLVLCTCIVFP